MIAALLVFLAAGLGLFYAQSLLLFTQVHLRLLALLLFYLGLRPSLALALSLGVVLGMLQDSYATTPFGLHLGAALALVAGARFLRRRLLLQRLPSQVLASIVALVLHEAAFQGGSALFGLPAWPNQESVVRDGWEILATAALGPLMYHLVRSLEKFLRRFGWRTALSETTAYQPFS